VVFIVAVAVYASTLGHGLVWDDRFLLELAERSTRAGGIPALLGAEFRLYPEQAAAYYRPVVMLSLWFDRILSETFPFSFHLTNVLLHGLVSALTAHAGRLLTGSSLAGLLAGLLFAIHPAHAESVSFVSGRTDLWAAVFGMLSLLAWLRDRSGGAPSRLLSWPVWGGLAFLLACLSKEVAVALPAVVLAWDAVVPAGGMEAPRRGWWVRNRGWAASWGLSLAVLVALRWGVAGLPLAPGGGSYAESHVGEALRDWTLIPSMWLEYLRLLVVPWPLKIIYTPDQLGLTVWTAAGALGFAGIAWSTSGTASRGVGLLGLLWVFAFLLPVSGVVPLQGAIVAERFLYVPSVGFCLMAGAAASRLPDLARFPRPALAAAAVGVAGLLSAGAVSASLHWKDEVTLFTRVVRTTPGAWMGHDNLGSALAGLGRLDEAMTHYREAIRIKPDYPTAHYNLALLLERSGMEYEAIAQYREAIRKKPGFSEAHNNLGVLLERSGMADEAIAQYLEALRSRPDDAWAHKNLGNALTRRGRMGEAASHYREALRTRPDDAQAHYNLGIALKTMGQSGDAEAHLAEARRLSGPDGRARISPR
jgi:tetratricopeptide (TPR) repeat protein